MGWSQCWLAWLAVRKKCWTWSRREGGQTGTCYISVSLTENLKRIYWYQYDFYSFSSFNNYRKPPICNVGNLIFPSWVFIILTVDTSIHFRLLHLPLYPFLLNLRRIFWAVLIHICDISAVCSLLFVINLMFVIHLLPFTWRQYFLLAGSFLSL